MQSLILRSLVHRPLVPISAGLVARSQRFCSKNPEKVDVPFGDSVHAKKMVEVKPLHKLVLIFSLNYKTWADIPDSMSAAEHHKLWAKARIVVNITIGLLTFLVAYAAYFGAMGKLERKRAQHGVAPVIDYEKDVGK